MKPRDLKRELETLFAALSPETSLTLRQIAQRLRLHGNVAGRIQKALNPLVKSGAVQLQSGNRYGAPSSGKLVTGEIHVVRSGRGFLSHPDYPAGIPVDAASLKTALPGDRVTVRLPNQMAVPGERQPSAEVIQVLETGRAELVGTVRMQGQATRVVPIDPVYPKPFRVRDLKGAVDGDRVLLAVERWTDSSRDPEGSIVEVIGPEDKPSIDTEVVVRHYRLKTEFPAIVRQEAETVSTRVTDPGPRLDLRDQWVLTIDPVRARDYDDALSMEKDAQGNRVIGVHIADVSHFVTPGSALDHEARERGNSIYFPDRVIPMLPEQLSNGICSLRPDEDRLAFSVFIHVDAHGRVLFSEFARSIIRSRLRLNYEMAMRWLEGKPAKMDKIPSAAGTLLHELDRVAQQWRGIRMSAAALDLDLPEIEILMDSTGAMNGVRSVPYDRSHQLVEECMVGANEAVATALAGSGIPVLSRYHGPPDEAKLDELQAQLIEWGYTPGNLKHPPVLASFLHSLADDPLAYHARMAVLRGLKRAIYTGSFHGHFGLSKAHYCHFTSPIRRYPDLVIHRQLAHWLDRTVGDRTRKGRGGIHYPVAELDRVGLHCSNTERVADEAERTVNEIKVYRYLDQQRKAGTPVELDGIIVNVLRFGFFVDVPSLQIQGLVQARSLSNAYVHHEPQQNRLRSDRQTYAIGQRVKVRVVGVDIDSRRVDFEMSGSDKYDAVPRKRRTRR
ncbi:MAG: hypothetical protein A2269_01225 [Lentisphaerae bacterium RIFOXYA12_FULL_60_10]|nr:MAG: hypothetical protein A2269_01225 [Lentisphaerae bacterium RIFOXYA12_FULL_60_10]